ncbi:MULTISPECIES: CPBP family intramembrane glutamic endopeptidase [Ruminococcus]|uniref:Membrane protease YdiL, CAAX protease family n=1 Tax=Ruminococcus flavefaciens TaxID=1265 RepID=A0A1M7LZ34_RUMFL|nr:MULTISPECIES: type II CAAX endopeptidase family protein [Ruminococcus]MCR4795630.1 CPBP family intramembrane metalloprotease [Ruminococcus sp.]SHM83652.1 Membrane protease YdiL, CAAX protease family [Ruminococcus flavefaciens]
MQNKKKTLLRIFIYLVLTYVPVYILGFVFSDGKGSLTSRIAGFSLMLFPMIAVIITRLVTKEGFRDAYLGFGKRGSGKYYILAALYPIALPFVSAVILHLFIVKNGSISESYFANDSTMAAANVFISITTGIAIFVNGVGEELGWRAYLTPKLEEFMPTPLAVVVTGSIWALWHGPLLAYGYDFGRDYDFFPYGGFIAMIVMCIFWSAILTWLTKRTNSVYPAALCHILIDTVLTSVLSSFLVKADETPFELKTNQFWMMIISVFPMIIVCGSICMVLACRKKKETAVK